MSDLFAPEDVIFSYSRAQAIEDGVLVDVSELAKEAGFKYPAAITAGVFAELNSDPRQEKQGQSFKGRMWDALNVLFWTIKSGRGNGERVDFKVRVSGRYLDLYSLCGPGDNAEPVITIMLPGED